MIDLSYLLITSQGPSVLAIHYIPARFSLVTSPRTIIAFSSLMFTIQDHSILYIHNITFRCQLSDTENYYRCFHHFCSLAMVHRYWRFIIFPIDFPAWLPITIRDLSSFLITIKETSILYIHHTPARCPLLITYNYYWFVNIARNYPSSISVSVSSYSWPLLPIASPDSLSTCSHHH